MNCYIFINPESLIEYLDSVVCLEYVLNMYGQSDYKIDYVEEDEKDKNIQNLKNEIIQQKLVLNRQFQGHMRLRNAVIIILLIALIVLITVFMVLYVPKQEDQNTQAETSRGQVNNVNAGDRDKCMQISI